MIVYRIINNIAPAYLSTMFRIYVPNCSSVRSAADKLKIEIKLVSDKVISHVMYATWNQLPLLLHLSAPMSKFKKDLKTYYCILR